MTTSMLDVLSPQKPPEPATVRRVSIMDEAEKDARTKARRDSYNRYWHSKGKARRDPLTSK